MDDRFPIRFWCIDCEDEFVALPETCELEQANCVHCGRSCLAFEYEYERAEKAFAQEGAAKTGIFFVLLGWLGLVVSPAFNVARPKILDCVARIDNRRNEQTVFRARSQEDVEQIIDRLFENEIIGQMSEPIDDLDGGVFFEVYVDDRDFGRAQKMIDSN